MKYTFERIGNDDDCDCCICGNKATHYIELKRLFSFVNLEYCKKCWLVELKSKNINQMPGRRENK